MTPIHDPHDPMDSERRSGRFTGAGQDWQAGADAEADAAAHARDRARARQPSLLAQIYALTDDAMDLVRKEIELAKTEIDEKITQAQYGVILIFAGLMAAAVAAFLLAQALVAALAVYLGAAGAALAVGGVVLVGGLIALSVGLKAKNLAPRRTMQSASDNAKRLKETIHDQIK
jgi:hypothetical protein